MAKEKSKQASLLIFTLITGLLSQSLVIPVVSTASFDDKKCCNNPSGDPHGGGSHHTPSHGSGGSQHGRPSHGHGSSPSNCGTPPSGGHYDPAPPTTGGSPPSTDTPSTPSTPTYGSPPTSPSIDPGTPSTPTYGSPPTSPSVDPGTPATPTYGSPPATPIDPGTPGSPTIPGVSSPPFSFNPNSPPFPCTYWLNHPTLIWGLFGFYGATLGGAFGLTSNGSPAAPASQVSLAQALSNTHTDGIGALYREGTAALLNSMAIRRFPFTTEQVRDRFVSALGSNKAASAQARVFKMANEGKLKART
ncbi:Protodermal factor 1 [Heracleum sosnowskyi]|uniref:Protodermal factor 1 n=1 Tax=Heracleum sosnowskyi TaxID=360622 RepID=A0AAD8IPJ8_9APIA|nr:Protodermal factor 1 [Heracleum sosnowskyi]